MRKSQYSFLRIIGMGPTGSARRRGLQSQIRFLGHGLPLLIVVGLLSAAGCRRAGRLDDKERNNRIVMKAHEMVDQGDYAAAATLFNKVLENYPEMARPHLDLALLLHDRQKDHMRAIYHYHRYLELRPNSEKEKMILDRIRQAEQTFVSQRVRAGGVDGRSALDLLEENRVLRAQLEDTRRSAGELKAEVNMLRDAERQRTRADVIGDASATTAVPASASATIPADAIRSASPEESSPVPPAETTSTTEPQPPALSPEPSTPAQRPATAMPEPEPEPSLVATRPVPPVKIPEPSVAAARPASPVASPEPSLATARRVPSPDMDRTYTVQRGDSLSKIAYKVYGDATQWRTIQDANRNTLGDSVNVRVGQVLVIP